MNVPDAVVEAIERMGWEVESDETLICPCGETIEWDGECPECGPSPMMRLGLI